MYGKQHNPPVLSAKDFDNDYKLIENKFTVLKYIKASDWCKPEVVEVVKKSY